MESPKPPRLDKKEYYQQKNNETMICPYNSSHIIKKRRYKKHCIGCPNNPNRNPHFNAPFIQKGCNHFNISVTNQQDSLLIEPSTPPTLLPFLHLSFFNQAINEQRKPNPYYSCNCYKLQFSSFNDEMISVMKKRVYTLYNHICKQYPELVAPVINNPKLPLKDDLVELKTVENISMPDGWEYQSCKHTQQCFSILQHLIEHNILSEKRSIQHIIEGGAGSGMLSAYYSILCEENSQKIFCKRSCEQTFRYSVDLSDLCLKDLLKLSNKTNVDESVSVVGKHLCGSATDMTLKMAVDCCNSGEIHLGGIGIALCCHSKGDAHYYCNTSFFQTLGVSLTELTAIHKMSSWAVALNPNKTGAIETEHILPEDIAQQPTSTSDSGETIDDRRVVGEMSRTILNIGRVLWLKEQKCIKDVGLIKYIQPGVSPENVLLWAEGIN
ncbi:tRNA:m(4)X modification enzyme TRM13 [Entamoeba marina]